MPTPYTVQYVRLNTRLVHVKWEGKSTLLTFAVHSAAMDVTSHSMLYYCKRYYINYKRYIVVSLA